MGPSPGLGDILTSRESQSSALMRAARILSLATASDSCSFKAAASASAAVRSSCNEGGHTAAEAKKQGMLVAYLSPSCLD